MTLAPTRPALPEAAELPLIEPDRPWQAVWPALAVGIITFAAVALTTARVLLADTYLGLYAGRWIAAHGIPHSDPFTVAGHGRMWVDQQWLAHLAYYGAWSAGGYAAVGALSALAIASSFGLLAALMVRFGVTPARAVMWSTVAFFVCATNTVTRAQSFAYPLFVLLLWLIVRSERVRGFDRRLALGLPLIALWANLHGSAMMGAGLFAAWCIYRTGREAYRQPAGAAAANAVLGLLGLAMVFATPYSPSQIVDYYRSVLDNPVIARYIIEWFPATFGGLSLEFVAMLAITAVVLGIGIGRRTLPSVPVVAVTVLFALAGAHAVRYQVWFAFPAALLVAAVLQGSDRDTAPAPVGQRFSHLLPWAAVALLGIAAVAAPAADGQALRPVVFALSAGLVLAGDALARTPATRRGARRAVWAGIAAVGLSAAIGLAAQSTHRFEKFTPRLAMARAAAYAEQHPRATVLADDTAGPAMLWYYPALDGRIGYDARLEIFSSAKLLPFMHWVALDSPTWAAVTRQYDVMVIDRIKNAVVAKRSQRLPGWTTLAADADGVALVRR